MRTDSVSTVLTKGLSDLCTTQMLLAQRHAGLRQEPNSTLPKTSSRELSVIRGGLIPSWVKDSSAAVRMIN